MPEASMCVGISNEIDALEAERNGIQQELQSAPPSMKPFLLREIRRINMQLGQLRQQLRACQEQTPPVARPDLVARTVQLHVNHSTKKLGVAALIKNVGRGPAHGPFRIDLAATLYRGGVTTSFVQVFEVPAGVTLYGEPVIAQAMATAENGQAANGHDQPVQGTGGQMTAAQNAAFPPFPGWPLPPIFSQEYVTEDMVLPLFYRDESPSATYEFEFIVDSEQQVSESNEGNNHFFVRWWTTRPESVQRTTPFEVEMKEETRERKQVYKEGMRTPAD